MDVNVNKTVIANHHYAVQQQIPVLLLLIQLQVIAHIVQTALQEFVN